MNFALAAWLLVDFIASDQRDWVTTVVTMCFMAAALWLGWCLARFWSLQRYSYVMDCGLLECKASGRTIGAVRLEPKPQITINGLFGESYPSARGGYQVVTLTAPEGSVRFAVTSLPDLLSELQTMGVVK